MSDERKVVSPRHEGHKRVYSPEEVVEIIEFIRADGSRPLCLPEREV
mgnify:CR=1 FL=1